MSALAKTPARWAIVLLTVSLAACGGDDSGPVNADRDGDSGAVGGAPAQASAPRFDADDLPPDAALDPGRKGPAFDSDREAVEAFEAAYRDVDLNRMQELWWRMNAAQRLAAHRAGEALSDGATMGAYRRMLPAENLLDAENVWELEAAAEREARGESAVPDEPAPRLDAGAVVALERGVLRGVLVVAGSGEPVAGVQLVASPLGPAALQLLLGSGEELATVSAADGTFEIAGVPAGDVSLVGQKLPEYPAISHRTAVVAGETVEVRVELPPVRVHRLELPVVVAGIVRDELSGEPVAGVLVSAGRHGGATSDARGRYLIAEADLGEIELTAEHADYHPARSVVMARERGRIDHDLTVRPITTGILEGLVVDAGTGAPLPGSRIVLLGEELTTDGDGRFRLEGVEAGAVTLTGHRDRYRSGVAGVEVPRRATAEVRLELEPITEGTVLGVVTDASTGKPLAGVRVAIGPLTAETGADGRFELADVPAGEAGLTARKAVFEPLARPVAVLAAETLEVALALDPITHGDLVVRVVASDTRQPVAGAEIVLADRRAEADAQGLARFDGLRAGDARVSARQASFEPGAAAVKVVPADSVTVEIELDRIRVGVVRGVVRDAGTGRPVAGARVAVGGREVETDAAGRFQVADVEAGGVGVSVRHADYGDGVARGELVGGGAVDLDVRLDLRREDVARLESALAAKGAIDLYGIHFDSGSDQFKPSSLGTLEAVLKVIERAPERAFRIAGHTDSDGTDAYNQDLSERRARTVIRWLVERGVAADRLSMAGYGESRPAATNDTPSGKALNRRVELGYAR